MSGDILDDIDAAIEDHEDYVEWHGSEDAATWTADGSHEIDTGGHYYGDDLQARSNPWPIEAWQQILLDALSRPIDREAFDPQQVRRISPSARVEAAHRSRRQFQAWDDVTMRQLFAYQEQINRIHRAHRATYDAIVYEAGRVSWQRLTEPDPADMVRETVATWQPGEVPARPIEAVLREIVKEQG